MSRLRGLPPLWECPQWENLFVTRNMAHSCGQVPLEEHFEGKDPVVREIFDRYLEMVREFGEILLVPQKTRIVFMVRVRFAGAVPRKRWLPAGFFLKRRIESPRFHKIEFIPPRYHAYQVQFHTPADVDNELREWLREAYGHGCQMTQ